MVSSLSNSSTELMKDVIKSQKIEL